MSVLKNIIDYFSLEGGTRPHIVNIARPRMLWNYLLFFIFRKFNLPHVPYKPVNLMVEVSTRCNLTCPACERELFKEELGGLPKENVKLENLRYLAPLLKNVYSVYLVSGIGEPFCNPEFWNIHAFFKSFGLKTGYFTNTTFLTEELVEKTFVEKVNAVMVSVDSFDEKKYAGIKKGADLPRAKAMIKLFGQQRQKFKARHFSLGLNFIFRRDNYTDILDYLDFAKELGVDFVHCTTIITHLEKDKDLSFFLVEEALKKEIFNQAAQKAERLKLGLRLPKISLEKKETCGYLWRGLSIFSNGDVCPCPFFRTERNFYYQLIDGKIEYKKQHMDDCVIGNYLQEDIRKIWNGSRIQNLRKTVLGQAKVSPCLNCYYKFDIH